MARPTKEDFTRKEWALIQRLRTPHQVQQYLNGLPYNAERKGPTLRSFRGVVRTGTAHCLEAVLLAAVVLEQHGYPLTCLDLHSHDHLDHVLFLYRKNDRWGTVARSRDPGLHGRKPVFKDVRSLVDSYFDPFVDCTGRIVSYGVGDLADLGKYDWRFSKRNVWKVERYFVDLAHRRFHGANRRYRELHARYLAYRARYPDRKPLYYTGKRAWKPGYPKGKP